MTSPCAREPSAQSVLWFVLSLRNRTEPSHSKTLAPPGWKLLMPQTPGDINEAPALPLQLSE
jgi:hypothetical protein